MLAADPSTICFILLENTKSLGLKIWVDVNYNYIRVGATGY